MGGKMDVFQKIIGPYILSIAKPNWQYWIHEQAYARFNPAATADPASLVFPVLHPQASCPTNYSIFWLQKTGQIRCRGCE
jgi:hypothetical protein